MKAETQYNDLTGTAAADVNAVGGGGLQEYLVNKYKKYDAKRYDCSGCEISFAEGGFVSIDFVCYDNKEKKYVRVSPEKEISREDILSTFFRLNVVIGNKMEAIDEPDEIIHV